MITFAARLRAREKESEAKRIFTVVFYGLRIFGCKNTQLCVTRCDGIGRKKPASATMCNALKTRAKLFLELEIHCSLQLSYGRICEVHQCNKVGKLNGLAIRSRTMQTN